MLLSYSDENDERLPKLKKTIDGRYFHKDNNDDIWCMINYIDGSYTVDQVETAEQSLEAAKTYGRFLKYLWDFNPDNCHITIKNFHNLQNRIQQFNSAIEQNPVGRIDGLFHEIEKISKYGFLEDEWLRVLEESMPLRITHNDTKISNVLLDKHSNKGLCVIDLDTVMPGYIINDFGDMVRTFTPSLPEDHQDLNRISVRLPVFESLIKGFLGEIRNLITEAELKYLVSGALFITYEQALRFLTDFILGDIYYKTDYENHNLYRAQNQLILLEDLILKRDSMEKMILQNI
jgi:hypothetical protein